MIHVGFDIGKQSHCVAAIHDDGSVCLKPWSFGTTPDQFAALETKLRQLEEREPLRIGIEATGQYWVHLEEFLRQQGREAGVFNPLLSSSAARRQVRGRKTDPDDALVSARVVRDRDFEPMTQPSPLLNEIRIVARQRAYLADQLRNAKKRLGSLVDVLFPEFNRYLEKPFGATGLKVLETYPEARCLAKAHLTHLKNLVVKASRKRLGRDCAVTIREGARNSLAKDRVDPGRAAAARSMIAQIRFLQEQIADLGRVLTRRYAKFGHVMDSVPGIGPVTGPTILAEVGDLSRFKGRDADKKVLALAGAEPRIRQSGKWVGKIKMSKRGRKPLRTALYQAANVARQRSPFFKATYERQIARGKHHQVALSHVMRKLVRVLCVVIQQDRPYQENHESVKH